MKKILAILFVTCIPKISSNKASRQPIDLNITEFNITVIPTTKIKLKQWKLYLDIKKETNTFYQRFLSMNKFKGWKWLWNHNISYELLDNKYQGVQEKTFRRIPKLIYVYLQ